MADKKIGSRLVETSSIEKIFQIDDHVGAATSGLVADARVLVDYARLVAQINKVTYSEKIGVDLLVKRICDYKQNYTRSEEHTSELQSQSNLVCRLLLEKKKNK